MKKNIIKLITVLSIVFIPHFTEASFVGSSPIVVATSTCSIGLSCGLVGYWTFDGKDVVNGVALDKSGNSNTGVLSSISTSTFFAPGKLGQGFNFDGSNDTVNAGSATVIDNLPAMSISMWVKLNTYGASGGGYLINKGDTSSGGHGWSMYLTQANGLVTFTARYSVTSLLSQSASNTFAPTDINKWVHLTVTWDGTTNSASGVKIYKNGSEISYSTQTNGSGSYLSDASNSLNIGDGGLISNRQTNGIVDDVRLYNRVLTVKEVSQLYSSGGNTKQGSSQVVTATSTCSVGLSCGLVGYWTFDGKDVVNGVVLDKSGNNNRVNLVNISTSTFFAPGKIGQGFNFDFSNDAANLSTNILSGRSSFSIMMWARKNKTATGALFASRSGGPYWRVTSVGGDTLLWVEKSDCSTGLNVSYPLLTDDKFHLVGITMDSSGNVITYKDGVSVGTTNFAGWDSVCTDANDWGSIGNYAASFPFGGVIDDVRIYNHALSASEISQLYSSGASTKQGSSQTVTATSTCSLGLSCGLVGYWTFDGKDMTNGVVLDKSGNNNRGNLLNIATSTFFNPGKFGQGFNFNGSNNYVNAGNSTVLAPTTAVTISAWVKPIKKADSSHYSAITSRNTTNYLVMIRQGGIVLFYLTGVQLWVTNDGTKDLFDGQWHLVTATYDGSFQRLYVDAILMNSSAITGNITSNANATLIGSDTTSATNYAFNGSLDDVRIYNRALSDSEIKQLYNMGK